MGLFVATDVDELDWLVDQIVGIRLLDFAGSSPAPSDQGEMYLPKLRSSRVGGANISRRVTNHQNRARGTGEILTSQENPRRLWLRMGDVFAPHDQGG